MEHCGDQLGFWAAGRCLLCCSPTHSHCSSIDYFLPSAVGLSSPPNTQVSWNGKWKGARRGLFSFSIYFIVYLLCFKGPQSKNGVWSLGERKMMRKWWGNRKMEREKQGEENIQRVL
jgi:hypothetical protein